LAGEIGDLCRLRFEPLAARRRFCGSTTWPYRGDRQESASGSVQKAAPGYYDPATSIILIVRHAAFSI
jgi:hypothetical protein